MALLPPGGLPEIVFSFDTTGSMSSCLAEVRSRLQDMIQRLQADIPAIRMAVFAHGDYCTKSTYVTKWIDFSTDIKELCDFVMNVETTGGRNDGGECYELVLRQVGEKLSWTPGSNRVLVVVGDDNPHDPNFSDNTQRIDWREEIQTLQKMGIRIYGVECDSRATTFFQTISKETGGRHLKLDNFTNIFDFLMAICYREHGADILDLYEKEVRARGGDGTLSKDMEGMFTSLRDGIVPPVSSTTTTITSGATKKGVKASTLMKTISMPRVRKPKPRSIKRPTTTSLKVQSSPLSLKMHGNQKPTKFAAPLLRREEVFENNFSLRDMDWSSWIKVISPDVPLKQEAQWEKRRGANPGFRKRTVFKSKNNKPAVYEFSVQTIKYGRRCVVFSMFCHHIPDNVNWETRLLGNKIIRAQVNNIVSQNCSVFVRRVVYRMVSGHVKSVALMKSYDYSWRRLRSRSTARHVYKQGSTISTDKV
ncbi:uncharacterized protein LOC124275375 isoform X3 [Haliotis rubra]|uniref:uncharacterized protein LOC124275375 isoform X3 n=1 Tax=Haliotis rubra TaxID=36100 RepID=UPI001EE6357E|nr:uncharacterized protein LOC124275375 isoform X3 [Haliotis rubra]